MDFTPHAMRHSYCSLRIQQGASVERMCRLARHSNPRLTWSVYVHEFKRKGQVSPEMAALDRMIGGQVGTELVRNLGKLSGRYWDRTSDPAL